MISDGALVPRRPAAVQDRLARWGLVAILGVFALATSLFNVMHPIWEAPDEPQHYEYIRYLVQHRALPQPVSIATGGPTELHQMPLYYVVQALLVGWVDDEAETIWHPNVYVTWPDHPARMAIATHRQEEGFPYRGYVLGVHLARLVSSLMAAGTVVATYALARRLLGNPRVALGAAAIVALTPGFAFTSATVNNDNGVILASALVLLHCTSLLRGNPSPRDAILNGVLLSMAALAKLSGLLLPGVAAFTWLLVVLRAPGQEARRRIAALAALALGVFLALTLWWPILYRDRLDLVAGNLGMGAKGSTLLVSPGELWSLARDGDTLLRFFRMYWGTFGWVGELIIPVWLGVALAAICAAAALGLLRFALARGWRAHDSPARLGLLVLTLYLVGLAYVFVARWLHTPLPGVDHGRFLYPAIPVVGILLALGLSWLMPRRVPVLGMFCVGLAAITLAVPFTISRESFPPPVPAWGRFDESLLDRRLGITYANDLSALGLGPIGSNVQPGEEVVFRVYWRAEEDQDSMTWAAFRLVDPTGNVPVSDHAVPHYYEFPPWRWKRGEVVVDERRLPLPEDAPPGLYALEMRVLDRTAVVDVALKSGAERPGWLQVAEFRVRPRGNDAPPIRLEPEPAFGNQLVLLGHDLVDTSLAAEQEMCITLYWSALHQLPSDYMVSVQLLDRDGNLRSQHDGPPHGGIYPSSRWEPGEVVPDRRCLALAGLPPAEYGLGVAVYRLSDGVRLRLGDEQDTDLLPLATVFVSNR